MTKVNEIRQDAINALIETLDWYDGEYSELHNETFNTDYYIIGTYRAKQALEEYSVFDAIEKVQDYERDNFGEVITDIANPEMLVNMLFYIIGEEVMQELTTFDEHYNDIATQNINAEIIEELESLKHVR